MSDACRQPASGAVIMENGNRMYRCETHLSTKSLIPFEEGNWTRIVRVQV